MAGTVEDELITYECDSDRTREIREHIYHFALHRRPETYGLITAPM